MSGTGRAGDPGSYAGPAHPDFWISADDAPLGHFRSAHDAFGWCCHEPRRLAVEELWAWRLRYQREMEAG